MELKANRSTNLETIWFYLLDLNIYIPYIQQIHIEVYISEGYSCMCTMGALQECLRPLFFTIATNKWLR